MTKVSDRCRHNRSWIICGGHAMWCYECGAWRPMRLVGDNGCAPDGRWTRPVGKGGTNPAMLATYMERGA